MSKNVAGNFKVSAKEQAAKVPTEVFPVREVRQGEGPRLQRTLLAVLCIADLQGIAWPDHMKARQPMASEMPRCRTCKHYRKMYESDSSHYCWRIDTDSNSPIPPDGEAVVRLESMHDAMAELRVSPDFGCVLHEPKSEETE